MTSQQSQSLPKVICLLVGDGGVGKSTFTERIDSEFEKKIDKKLGVKEISVVIQTNKGRVQFVLRDTLGQEKFGLLQRPFFTQAQCAILMFDVSSKTSYEKLPIWYNLILENCGNIPIVLVANKADLKQRIIKPKHIYFHRQKNINYYEISTKSNYNLEKPFIDLIWQLAKDTKLVTESPKLLPPEIKFEKKFVEKLEEKVYLASRTEIPEQPVFM